MNRYAPPPHDMLHAPSQRTRCDRGVARPRLGPVGVTMLLACVALSSLIGCAPSSSGGGPSGSGAKRLHPAEVSEYRGEKLGSVDDFRENSIKGPQKVDRVRYRLKVDGLVRTPTSLTYSDVTSGYPSFEKVVTLNCVEGWSVKVLWKGVRLTDLIDKASAAPAANTVIFHAADGYTSSLPLSYVRDRDLLLAFRMNGIELPVERGFPFQVVAEDKFGYKWVKWVTRIELSNDPGYRGYWEKRGYSNEAELTGP